MSTLYMNKHYRTIPPVADPKLFVEHNGQMIEVEIVDMNAGRAAVKVRAVNGYPFNMSHGPSNDYISHDGEFWYAEKWVNKSDTRIGR